MKKNDLFGSSESSLHEAIHNALANAGDYFKIAVMETLSSQPLPNKRLYEVRIVAWSEGV